MHFGTNRAHTLASLSVCVSLALPASQSLAEPPSQSRGTAQDKDKDIHNVVEYEFTDDQVLGDLTSPLGEVLTVRGKRGKHSLVRARGSFIDKLVRAVESF